MPALRVLLPVCLVASALAVAAASPASPAAAPAPEVPVASAAAGQGADEVLHDVMEGLKKQLKTLATATPDAARRTEALGAVAAMQALVLTGKLQQPSNLTEVPEAQRAAHALAFRKDMARLLVKLGEIEIALCEGRADDAVAAVKGLAELRDASHDAYQESGGEGHHDGPTNGDGR